jgi:hypothetical protein
LGNKQAPSFEELFVYPSATATLTQKKEEEKRECSK